MANVQIYQLDNAGSDLDNSALLAMDIPNPDASAASEVPYVTRKESIASLETQMLQTDEYTTALDTTNKSIVGAINEHHAVIGYNYDAYDDTSTYSVGDLCIYNNALYKCTTAITTAEAWNASHWAQTSIADEINELNTDKQDKLSNSDIPITVLSQSVSDATLKCTRYGNVACITGYFRTTASISANSSIFSGFPNPVVPSGDSNIYFIFLNETDNTLMRFRINRNYCELKNPVALASGKTFVGSVTYICD